MARGWARTIRQPCTDGCPHPTLEILTEVPLPPFCLDHPGTEHLHLKLRQQRRHLSKDHVPALEIGTITVSHEGLLRWLSDAAAEGGLLALSGSDGHLQAELASSDAAGALKLLRGGKAAELTANLQIAADEPTV
jgi:hypothetical protein